MQNIQVRDCPFCKKNTITILYIPKTFNQYKTSEDGSKHGWKKTQAHIVIQVKECSNCKKTTEEIGKKWREENLI